MRPVNLAALALAGALFGAMAHAASARCEPAGASRERCVAALPEDQVRSMTLSQAASKWCWAAAVSMVLRRWGVQVPQEQVVRAHWGAAVDLGVPPEAMTALLNRTWRDRAGRTIELTSAPLASSIATIAHLADHIADALRAGHPLVVAIPGHAMVVVRMEYEREADGRLVNGQAMVLDPASGTRRILQASAPVVALLRVSGAEREQAGGVHDSPAARGL